MAIKPETVKALNQDDLERIKQVEKKIDAELASRDSYNQKIISIVVGDLSSKIKAEIVRLYTEAGWKNVKFESCQKEGEWLSLQFP